MINIDTMLSRENGSGHILSERSAIIGRSYGYQAKVRIICGTDMVDNAVPIMVKYRYGSGPEVGQREASFKPSIQGRCFKTTDYLLAGKRGTLRIQPPVH